MTKNVIAFLCDVSRNHSFFDQRPLSTLPQDEQIPLKTERWLWSHNSIEELLTKIRT